MAGARLEDRPEIAATYPVCDRSEFPGGHFPLSINIQLTIILHSCAGVKLWSGKSSLTPSPTRDLLDRSRRFISVVFADLSHGQLASRASRREEIAIAKAPVTGNSGSCALASAPPGQHSLLTDPAFFLHADLERPRCAARGIVGRRAEVVAEFVLRR